MKLNWIWGGGGGVKTKKLSNRGVWIFFWNCSIYILIVCHLLGNWSKKKLLALKFELKQISASKSQHR